MTEKKTRVTGDVIEALPSTFFKVRLHDGKEILAHLSGKMKMNHIRILLGDRVEVEIGEYDQTRGRIVRRL